MHDTLFLWHLPFYVAFLLRTLPPYVPPTLYPLSPSLSFSPSPSLPSLITSPPLPLLLSSPSLPPPPPPPPPPPLSQLLEAYENDHYFQLVMEKHGDGLDLFEFIEKCPKVTEPLVSYMFRQVIAGLSYLHSKNILHRDVKVYSYTYTCIYTYI